jgi:coenzyme F420-reducing hydrogenase gamma subunit
MSEQKKLKIGWFTFTCCEDSTIMFTEMLNDHLLAWKKILEFRHFNVIKSKNELSDIDVAFVEGAICTDKDKEKLKKIREVSKHVVAIGSCAVTGKPTGNRNDFSKELKDEISPYLKQFHQNDTVLALHEVVEVDDKVPGCPMVEAKFVEAMDKYLHKFKIIPEDKSILNYKNASD